MATLNLASLLVKLKADTGDYKRSLKDAGRDTSQFGKRAGKALQGLAVAGFAGATAAAAKFTKDSVKEYADFERASAEVFTLLPDLSAKAAGQMQDDLRDFGVEAGRLTDETVPALYQAISAGVPRENVFEFLETASDAAMGGVTDLETAVDGITSVVNAYGQQAISAEQASDLLFTAVKGGKTTFDELARGLFNVTPTAAALGVEFGNITAALATMTAQGVPTQQATTQLRQLLIELSTAGSEADQALRQAADAGFAELVEEGSNLQDVLLILDGAAADNDTTLRELFGSVEAGGAALALTGEATDTFSEQLEAAGNAAGATEEAANKMSDTGVQAIKEMEAAFEDLKIVVGEEVAPAMTEFADNATKQIRLMARTEEWNQAREELLELGASWSDINAIVEDGRAKFDLFRTSADFERDLSRTEAGLRRLEIALEAVDLGLEVGTPAFHRYVDAVQAGADLIAEHPEQIESAAQADRKWIQTQTDVANATDMATDAVEEENEILHAFNLAGRDTVGISGDMRRAAHEVTQEYQAQQEEADRIAEATAAYEEALGAAEDALGSYFEKALEGADINEDLLGQFLSMAAQQGATADELRHIADATGDYSDEQIEAAISAATLQTEAQKVMETFGASRASVDEATAALDLLEQGEADTAREALALARVHQADVPQGLSATQESALDTKLGVDDMTGAMEDVPPEVSSTFDDENTYKSHFDDVQSLINKLNELDGKQTTSTHIHKTIQQETGVGGGPAGGPGLQGGGFTGHGPTNQPAGVVHGQEFVFSAPAVRNIGVDFLEGLHGAARRGDAGGQGGGDVIYQFYLMLDGKQSTLRGVSERDVGPFVRAARRAGVAL